MDKKGFTLVELIATLIILGVVGLIAFPIINNTIKEGKEDLYKSQLQEIEEAAEKWAYQNIDLLPNEGEIKNIKLEDLKKSGLLPLDIRDPRNDELLLNDMLISIKLENNIYVFNVNEESGTSITSEYNENAPILMLNGNPLEYIELASVYEDLGVTAKSKGGKLIEDVTIMYQYNGTEIGEINTNELKTYTIIYSVSDEVNGTIYTSKITRTVIVRDTTAPNIVVPEKIEITLTNASSYDNNKLLQDVQITDNSGDYTVTISGFDVSLGQKIVSYTACDSNNNCETKKRMINIVEG